MKAYVFTNKRDTPVRSFVLIVNQARVAVHRRYSNVLVPMELSVRRGGSHVSEMPI